MPQTPYLNEEAEDEQLTRGFARRDLARIAAVFGAGAIAASVGRSVWASGGVPDPAPAAKVRIGADECWTGPLAPGAMAASKMVAQGNRYSPHDERGDFISRQGHRREADRRQHVHDRLEDAGGQGHSGRVPQTERRDRPLLAGMPTVSRVTVGSAAETKTFCTALDKVIA